MPHISKRKLNMETVHELEQYIQSIVQDTNKKPRVRIFNEILTQTEKIMIAKRLGVLLLLKKGYSSYKISKLLKISPSTAERFQKDMHLNKYKHTVDWLWKQTREGSKDELIKSLIALAFTGKTKSFKKFVEEFE